MKKKGFFNLKLILIIFIIVLVVIASIFYIKDKLDDQELQSLNTTMLQIQAKIKVINERNKINNTSDYIGKDISEDELRKLNIENNGKVKLLDEEELKKLEITDAKKSEDFVINYETEEVYYLNGYKTEDNTIAYSLTDINNLVAQ